MKLETPRLILRPWVPEDAPDLFEFAKDERVGPIAGWPAHSSVEQSAEIIRTVFNHPQVYALELKENRRAIGCVGLLVGENSNISISEQEGEVAYWIGVPYWGQGLIPEAVRELMRHAFDTLELQALWCSYFADNAQSHSAQAKCGFRYQRTEKDKYNEFLDDYRTQHISRITGQEWRADATAPAPQPAPDLT
ncbi:MAG TPA: GNAT family N-acetyltransferase [Alcaligenes sp.]|nr:GNAT family N-acetyltransferase [Alcaligenes sp.]HRL27484.1 GNAT family N-acetyltransferase [Alcaligenes sp.]